MHGYKSLTEFTQFPARTIHIRPPKLDSILASCHPGRLRQHTHRLSDISSSSPDTCRSFRCHIRDCCTDHGDYRSTHIVLARSVLGYAAFSRQRRWYVYQFISPIMPISKLLLTKHSVLFTVANLVISNAYPADVQSLAGGVLNEVGQFGNSVGLAVTAAIAASTTEHSSSDPIDALLQGYRAAFWTIFAATVAVVFLTFFGLRKAGLVGKKDD